jgi:hypothetical protein
MQLHELNEIFLMINKSKNDFDLFLETGTLIGDTINNIKSEFQQLVSIEIFIKYQRKDLLMKIKLK